MKTGLVLEGGGMRGVFTTGVLDVLLDEDISFDKCIGVSAGAGHACSFLAKQKGRAFTVNTSYLKDKRYCSIYSLIKTGDMFGAEMIYHTIPEQFYPVDNDTFQKSGAEFYVSLTNCKTGRAEYKRIYDLYTDVEYVRASSSLPLLARIVELDGKEYLDGGLTDSIPVKFMVEDMACDKTVVVLTQPKGFVKKQESFLGLMRRKYKQYPKLMHAIENRHNMYNETLRLIDKYEAEGKLFVIRPETDLGIGRTEKNLDKLKASHDEGEMVCRKCMDALKKFLSE